MESTPGDQDLLAGEEPHAFDYTGRLRIFLILPRCFSALATGCGEVWNDPYPAAERGKSILYASFVERPKHLDPVQSYTEDEAQFTQQVYEPLLQYHYLKRPYELIPLTAVEMPEAALDRGRQVHGLRDAHQAGDHATSRTPRSFQKTSSSRERESIA